MSLEIRLKKGDMSLDDLEAIARKGAKVNISKQIEKQFVKGRALVDKWVKQERKIYGVTTGFGALSTVTISGGDIIKLQRNILLSHSAGVGNPLPEDVVRAMIAIRLNDFCLGKSGLSLATINKLIEILNSPIVPVVPEKGSVGASGDLSPMAHIALVLIGEGEAFVNSERLAGAEALKKCSIEPIELQAGEGLALINGTQMMTAIGALALIDIINLGKHADIAASMSLEVLLGTRKAFDPRIHNARPHPGQQIVASNMLKISDKSEIISSHEDCSRIQDAYSLRCSPQVHGATLDTVNYAKQVILTEMNSSTENPLIFTDSEDIVSGGNFHGQPVALVLDFLGIAVAELASISERRVERLVNPNLSGLPAFLVENGGLNSGFMIIQYTAAALVSDNKILAHPSSVDSIPTSANKEDHVSMGANGARKLMRIIENVEEVIAIELLAAAQGYDLFTNLKGGIGTKAAHDIIRTKVEYLKEDRFIAQDIDTVKNLLKTGKIVDAVENKTGKLG
ncbi:MAG: histidine ammonia-lyase [Desulfobacteraceae bacterium]|nr:histidine ammonia-lyase [Desulfobacteraceae bacterium]